MLHNITMTFIAVGLLLLGWLFLGSAVTAWTRRRRYAEAVCLLCLSVCAVTSGLGILTTIF